MCSKQLEKVDLRSFADLFRCVAVSHIITHSGLWFALKCVNYAKAHPLHSIHFDHDLLPGLCPPPDRTHSISKELMVSIARKFNSLPRLPSGTPRGLSSAKQFQAFKLNRNNRQNRSKSFRVKFIWFCRSRYVFPSKNKSSALRVTSCCFFHSNPIYSANSRNKSKLGENSVRAKLKNIEQFKCIINTNL